jgi:hypothetical protein
VAQLEAAAGEDGRCEDCNEVHDEDRFGLNELQGTIAQFMQELGLGDLAEDLMRTVASQREHQERMGEITDRLVEATRAADSGLEEIEGSERVEWALFRLGCGCVVPTLRVEETWTRTRDEFSDEVSSEQVRQIVEALASLGQDLLGVMRALQAEGR